MDRISKLFASVADDLLNLLVAGMRNSFFDECFKADSHLAAIADFLCPCIHTGKEFVARCKTQVAQIKAELCNAGNNIDTAWFYGNPTNRRDTAGILCSFLFNRKNHFCGCAERIVAQCNRRCAGMRGLTDNSILSTDLAADAGHNTNCKA